MSDEATYVTGTELTIDDGPLAGLAAALADRAAPGMRPLVRLPIRHGGRNDARHAAQRVQNHALNRHQLPGCQALDDNQAVAVEAAIGIAQERGLLVDDQRANREADGAGELQQDQQVAEPETRFR